MGEMLMYKLTIFLLFLFSASILPALNSNDLIYKTAANVNPTVTPTPDSSSDSVSIELDRDITSRPCPPGYKCRGNCDDNMSIVVTISDAKSENNLLDYNYTVSGGRIVGEGSKVNWDLTGAAPGTYKITVGVVDKSRTQLQTATKIITVQECEDGGDCVCPALSVDAPASLTQAGETMIFTANVKGGAADDLTYNWITSDGQITEGQGTPVIKVATNSKMAGKTVTATVEISGVCEVCPKTETGTGKIATKKRKKK